MIRVLQIVGGMDRAGAETMLMNLYRKIDRTQIQFDFLYFLDKKCDYDSEITALGGLIYRISEHNLLKRYRAMLNFYREHPEYKIVHSHTLFNNGINLFAAKHAGVKYRIAHSHSTADDNTSVTGKLYQHFSRLMIRSCATSYIACGKEAASFLFPWKKNVILLPNSVDVSYWAKIGEKYADYITEQFGFVGLKIIQVGRLQPVKNHKFTIQLAEFMMGKGVQFKIFIIGQGQLEAELEQEVKEKGLDDVISFLGLRTDIPELMAGADVMLMPSLYEGFPVVLVESQATGLRTIVSDRISDEVDLGVGLVDFLNLKAPLSDWANSLQHKPNLYTALPQRIDILSEKGFDINKNVEKVSQLYLSLHEHSTEFIN